MRRSPLAILPLLAFALRPALAAEPGAASPTEPAPAPVGSPGEAVSARPANVIEAERYAAQAFDAYEHQQYQRAVELYQRALAAASSADILYNIARVYDLGLHDGARASEYYRRYVAEPKAQHSRSELAERRIAALRAAQVSDGTLAPSATGGAADTAIAPSERALAPADSGWTWRETSALALAGAGVVALGVGVGFGLSAASQSDIWRDDCDGNVCRTQRGVDAAHRASDRAQVATLALAAGGALLAGGAAVWWLGPQREESPKIALHVLPAGRAAGQIGCSFSGRF